MLGTASAMPVVNRSQSAQALLVHGRLFLVDAGEGVQSQMMRFHVSMAKLEAVFISHIHGDHVFGLFGLLSTFGMGGRTAPLHVYGPGNLRPFIKFFLSYNEWLPFEIAFHQVNTRFPEVIMETKSVAVTAFPLLHGIETYGYIFREKEPMWNVRKECIAQYGLSLTEIGTLKRGEDVVREDGTVIPLAEAAYKPFTPRSYAYVSDTAVFPGEAEVLQGVTVLYHETTFLGGCRRAGCRRVETAHRPLFFPEYGPAPVRGGVSGSLPRILRRGRRRRVRNLIFFRIFEIGSISKV